MALNKVMLIGHLGADPEVREISNGGKVANFSIATNEYYRNKQTNERVEKTEWHNIVAWRNLADLAERFLRKGSQVYVEGKLQTRSWEGQDGNKRYTTEVVADEIRMLDRKGENRDDMDQGAAPRSQAKPAAMEVHEPKGGQEADMGQGEEDDLPF